MPLAGNFVDDDGDAMTMTATYSLNSGPTQPIPGGLFSIPNQFTIVATSAGLSDVGTYIISVIISDSQLSVSAIFTLAITNASPRLISTPSAVYFPNNMLTQMDLSTYFIDDDGDPMTLTATYSLNGGAATAIPGGIFTKPSEFMIEANPTSPSHVGAYTISLTVSDSAKSVTISY
jgi:hypothetical protein